MKQNVLKLFNDFVDALQKAQGATSNLVHQCGHPVQFMIIRDALRATEQLCLKIAPHNQLITPKTIITEKKDGYDPSRLN